MTVIAVLCSGQPEFELFKHRFYGIDVYGLLQNYFEIGEVRFVYVSNVEKIKSMLLDGYTIVNTYTDLRELVEEAKKRVIQKKGNLR